MRKRSFQDPLQIVVHVSRGDERMDHRHSRIKNNNKEKDSDARHNRVNEKFFCISNGKDS